MPFQPKKILPDFAALKAIFNQAREQIQNYPTYQTIINFLDATGRMQRILNLRIEELEAAAEDITFDTNVRDAGYWSPLVLSNNSGDSELVLTDGNAPIMVWIPTP